MTVPLIVVRNFLPVLQKSIQRAALTTPTSGFIVPRDWGTSMSKNLRFVYLHVDEDTPIGFCPEDALLLAAELVQHANAIQNRSQRPRRAH